MSRALFPGPYNDYSGVVREVLGDEYATVMAVFKALPELRAMVKSLHTDAKDQFNADTVSALEDIKAGLTLAQDKFKETVDCANKNIEDKNSEAYTALTTALKNQADTLRNQMTGWGSTLIDSMRQSQQPIIDEDTAAIEQAKEARVAELATALQDTANQRIADVNAAGNTMLGQIKAAQSNIQVLQYTNTADDISQAPKPSDVTAPAILFFTLNQGKPANVFRAYTWNTTAQAWGTKTLEMTQPADGKQGNPGPAGNAIIATTFPSGQAVPAVTRPDGSPVIQGDLVLNGTNGSLWKNTSATVGSPTWTAAGSLLGPQGTTTVTGVDLFASAQSVRLFVQMYWDGGVNNKETVKWPYGYIFKSPPVTYFSSNIGGAGSSSYDPTTTPSDGWQANVSNQTISGFTYKHCGPWPGNGGEQLALVVEGIPDYAAMKAAGWTPTNDQVMNANTGRVPVGMSAWYPSTAIPYGWMEKDGSTFDVNKYPQLAVIFPNGQLPNDLGLFMRAYDPAGSEDSEGSTRGLLSYQEGSIAASNGGTGFRFGVTGFWNSDSVTDAGFDTITSGKYPSVPRVWNVLGQSTYDVKSAGQKWDDVMVPGVTRPKNRNYVPVIYAGVPAY